MKRRSALAVAAAALTVTTTACGSSAVEPASDSQTVDVENCGAQVTFTAAPKRVVLLRSAAVPFLHELGVMDRVTARAGQYPEGYYDEKTLAELEDIPLLTDKIDTSGHLQISKEVVISQEPDLVLGQVENLSRSSLAAVDIPLLEEPALCEQGEEENPDLDDVYSQMTTYGRVFGKEREAAEAVARLKKRMAEVKSKVGASRGRTAAVLYPTVGGGVTYAYGTKSTADPQLRAAGFENVFGDVEERVFEVTLEELLDRDPDVLVLLHSDGSPAEVEESITELPGSEKLTAVRNGDVMTQLFNFTEPPTPLSIDGLERIVERFGPA